MSLGWFLKNRPDILVTGLAQSKSTLFLHFIFIINKLHLHKVHFCPRIIFIIYVYLKELYLHNWALSIQPKFRKFRSETRWNGPFLLGPTEIFGTTFEGHRFDRSAHFGRVDGPFHLT